MGTRRVEAEGREPKISRFFLSPVATKIVLSSLSWGSLNGIVGGSRPRIHTVRVWAPWGHCVKSRRRGNVPNFRELEAPRASPPTSSQVLGHLLTLGGGRLASLSCHRPFLLSALHLNMTTIRPEKENTVGNLLSCFSSHRTNPLADTLTSECDLLNATQP